MFSGVLGGGIIGGYAPPAVVVARIDTTAMSTYGNMTSGGGVASVYNSSADDKVSASSALKATVSGFSGVIFGTPKIIDHVVVHATTDFGFAHDGQSGDTFQLELYVATGSQPGETGGTLAGSVGSTSDNTPVANQTIACSVGTAVDFLHVRPIASAGDCHISKVEVWGH